MKLEGKIDELIELILNGETYRAIAAKYSVSLSTLHEYLNMPEHSARATTALDMSADSYSEKAEEAIIAAPSDSVEIARARELAQHYRWKASKRSPRRYGDKIDITSKDEALVSPLLQIEIVPPKELD